VIVREVARLALALRVEQAVSVLASPRILVPTEFSVARGAHIL